MLRLTVRTRMERSSGTGAPQTFAVEWAPERTAIVVCDMWEIDHHTWSDHSCLRAAKRIAEMAPHMNRVLAEARGRGVSIIHCPSGCMDAYRDWPQRRLAQSAPRVPTKVPLRSWYGVDPAREPPLPVTEEGFCDDPGHPTPPAARQIDSIDIADVDLIARGAEPFYVMKQRGIANLLLMGAHANSCLLGRPFGIRHMVYEGVNLVLLRDLSDSICNERRPPFVDHLTGNDLVIEHIERYWCATATSADIVGAPFRFMHDRRPQMEQHVRHER